MYTRKTILFLLLSLSFSYLMAQPLAITKNVTQIGCNGTTGSATISGTGGLAPYTYEWKDFNGIVFSTNPSQPNLSRGAYFVTVMDANMDVVSDSIGIQNQIIGYIQNLVGANCPLQDGSAQVYISGGNAPYTYLWSDGSTANPAINLAADAVMQVQVKDLNGCDAYFYDYATQSYSVVGTATIPSYSTVTATNSTTPEQCPLKNGTVTMNPSGGTAPYTYFWNTIPAQNTKTATGLETGWYSVKVKDAIGCSSIQYVYVNPNPGVLNVTAIKTNDYCGKLLGDATITITGGVSPYTVKWPNGSSALSQTGLGYGVYNVSVTDQNACVFNLSIFIDDLSPVNTFISSTNTNCTNNSGTATISANGGVAPYTYLWNTGATTPSITGLSKNYYSVLVKDVNGCPSTKYTLVDINSSCYGYISGEIFQDNNDNCIKDAGELPIMNTCIYMNAPSTSKTLYDSYVNTRGSNNYKMRYVLPDQYTVTAYDLPVRTFNCPATGNYLFNIPVSGVNYLNNNFAMHPKSLDEDVSLLYNCRYSDPRPGFDYAYSISYKNIGTVISDGFVEVVYSDLETFVSSTPAPDVFDPINKILRFNYSSLMLGEIRSIEITYNLPATTLLGSTYSHAITADIGAVDPTPLNNTRIDNFTVVGSYDPNDIRVSLTEMIADVDTLLTYTIRFQNTGTYPAELVIVKDALEANLDTTTIQDVVASHPFKFRMLDNSIAEFAFENINLPDSTRNEKDSHGFVSYTIKRKKNLVPGTEILNSANIYFDYNVPVLTNTAVSRIANPTGVLDQIKIASGKVYPNPAKDYTEFSFEKEITSLKLLNAAGIVVMTETINKQKDFRISLSLSKGMYFYTAMNVEGNLYSGKIVIE